MNPESFHFLWETANQPGGAILVVSVCVGILLVFVLICLLYLKRIHPVLIWLILASAFFGFSQSFPENRPPNQVGVIVDVIGSGLITWFMRRAVRKRDSKAHVDEAVEFMNNR
jgi:hypothetical protein